MVPNFYFSGITIFCDILPTAHILFVGETLKANLDNSGYPQLTSYSSKFEIWLSLVQEAGNQQNNSDAHPETGTHKKLEISRITRSRGKSNPQEGENQ